MHERIFHFDIIRTVACLMVIIMHAPMPSDRIIGVFTWGITYLTMPCIGLFFALSGALLLSVKNTPLDSVNFVKKRGGRFILPVLLWSLIYLFVNGTFTAGDINMLIKSILSLPFYRQEGVLWFMYVLIGLYIIAPVISPWLSQVDKKTLKFYLFIWGITLLYPFFKPWLQLEESPYGILYYSSGFLGYFILGFYLRRFGIYLRFLTSIFLLCIVILIPVVYKLFIEQYGLDFGDIFWYLSLDCPILVILWWNILKYLADWLERFSCIKHFCVMFSNLSFGMYLCHILIQRYWLWHVSYILNIQNYILQTFIIIILTILFSYALSYLLSKLPLGNQIICYKNK